MSMMVSDELLVAHPPKCGGSSVTAYLFALGAASWKPLKGHRPFKWGANGHQSIRIMSPYLDRHVVSLHRNPWDRLVSWYCHFRLSSSRGLELHSQFSETPEDFASVVRGMCTVSGPALDRGDDLYLVGPANNDSGRHSAEWYRELRERGVGILTGLWEHMHTAADGTELVDEWWTVDSATPLGEQVRRTVLEVVPREKLVENAATIPLGEEKNVGTRRARSPVSEWFDQELAELVAYHERELVARFGYPFPSLD